MVEVDWSAILRAYVHGPLHGLLQFEIPLAAVLLDGTNSRAGCYDCLGEDFTNAHEKT